MDHHIDQASSTSNEADIPQLQPDRRLWVWHASDEHPLNTAALGLIETLKSRYPDAGFLHTESNSVDAPSTLARRWLGQDADFIWLNSWQGLCPNTLAIASGCLRAGGLLLLTTPPIADWPNHPNPQAERFHPYQAHQHSPPGKRGRPLRYVKRLADHLGRLAEIHDLNPLPDTSAFIDKISSDIRFTPRHLGAVTPTDDQRAAIAIILRAANGQRRKPALITADRGRGKSTAMGMAAAALLADARKSGNARQIGVTAADRNGAATLLHHAALQLKLNPASDELVLDKARLRYLPIDQALQADPSDLLLVDEAAGVSLSLLEQLVERFPRIVFATTLHGYEGSGRGFALKFETALKSRTRGLRRLQLSHPIRWRHGDPLETGLNRLLLLDTELVRLPAKASKSPDRARIQTLSAGTLAKNESLLRAVFGLLVQAHYRTQPSDAQTLLDNPAVRLFTAHLDDQVVAVLQLSLEGQLSQTDTDSILAGRSRPRGHLLPEVLGCQLGLSTAPSLGFARIQRLVVHPDCQGKGLGSRMLEAAFDDLKNQLDCLGVSYGADTRLTRFWLKNGYQPVRLGETPNPASGLPSAIMLKALRPSGTDLITRAKARYRAHFLLQIGHAYRQFDPQLLAELAPTCSTPGDAHAERDLNDFAYAERPFEASLPVLHQRLLDALGTPAFQALPANTQALLVATVLQRHSFEEIDRRFDVCGRSAILAEIRAAFRALLAA